MRLYTCIKCYTKYKAYTKQFYFTYKTKQLSILYKDIHFSLQELFTKQLSIPYWQIINNLLAKKMSINPMLISFFSWRFFQLFTQISWVAQYLGLILQPHDYSKEQVHKHNIYISSLYLRLLMEEKLDLMKYTNQTYQPYL